jgi:hypothetical protein
MFFTILSFKSKLFFSCVSTAPAFSSCASTSVIFFCLITVAKAPDAEADLLTGCKGGCSPAFCAACVVLAFSTFFEGGAKAVLFVYCFRQSAQSSCLINVYAKGYVLEF